VFGRVTELARVSQPKYNLAMSVVMGRDLDSIIVDTKETAEDCIQWLRTNQVAPMTFYPLDIVRPKACIISLPTILSSQQSGPCSTFMNQCGRFILAAATVALSAMVSSKRISDLGFY